MKGSEVSKRLAARVVNAGLTLTGHELSQLGAYYELLDRWNAKINLTALPLDPPTNEALDRLLIEPLIAARYVANSAIRWFDLGSGAGSPAIPLKILRPRAHLTMVESRGKKAAFLSEAVRAVELTNAVIENSRFEDTAKKMPGVADLITVRAVKPDAVIEPCHRLLRDGGRLLWFGLPAGVSTPGLNVLESAQLCQSSAGSTITCFERVFHVEQKS